MELSWDRKLPWDLIAEVCKKEEVPPYLIAAMIQVESAGDKNAMRFEPDYKWLYRPEDFAKRNRITLKTEITFQSTSYSYLQIMGAVARELGHEGPMTVLITNPSLALTYGCRHFANYFKKYQNIMDAVSSYNQGSPKKSQKTNLYLNQEYVTKVLNLYVQVSGQSVSDMPQR